MFLLPKFLYIYGLIATALLFRLCLTAQAVSPTGPPPALPTSFSRSTSLCQYDALIVGGGPSGLSSLSALGRLRRTAIAFDSGQYRNLLTRRQHDIIGSDGLIPANFREQARRQILQYPTVSIYNTTISNILKKDGCFRATDIVGQSWTARKVFLGTGLSDVLPETPGVQEYWGKGIYWCPWCDGYENRERQLGVLGDFGASTVKAGMYLQSLNRDITLFPNGTFNDSVATQVTNAVPLWLAEFEKLDVKIDNRIITKLTRLSGADEDDGNDNFLVTFDDGTTTTREAFLVNYPTKQTSSLGEEMGIAIYDGKLFVNQNRESNIEGVYPIGDANSDNSTNVPHAMWSAKSAAVDCVHQLALEDAEDSLGVNDMPADGYSRKRSEAEFARREIEVELAYRDLVDIYVQVLATHRR